MVEPPDGVRMTATPNQGAKTSVRDQAADWFVRLQSDAVEADWVAFGDWLDLSVEHGHAYDAVEAMWVALDDPEGLIRAQLAATPAVPAPRRMATPRPAGRLLGLARSRTPWAMTAAAMAAGVALAVGGVSQWAAPPPVVYETAHGQTRVVMLEDGTRVHLNSGSKISVSFDHDARRVVMADAEGAFDVAKDSKRPFLITAGDRQIRVVGTEFDVLRHAGRLVLTVRRGVVEVRPQDSLGSDPVRLTVGAQLVHSEGEAENTVRQVAPDAAFAWQTGHLVYDDQPLSAVADDLTRYLPVPVRVQGEHAAKLRFSGVLQLDTEDAMVRRLEAYLPIRAEHTPAAVILRGRDAES
jgi:transmembrane sensor